MGIDALNFCGKYELNANQKMPDQKACLMRDYMLGATCSYARNGEVVSQKLADFYNGQYNKDKSAPCNIVFDIPSNLDAQFEENMNKVGQKFNKIA